jgi:glycosyltransferase involved in cell wall biosynthesis
MKESPFISVLMPVYNAASYLEDAIKSVLEQSFDDFEFLIINDGSTDDSLEIIEQQMDKRIRIINKKNNFIESLNMGLMEARGKYIARMDADDRMHSDRLKKQCKFMEANPDIDVCGTWAETFGTSVGAIQTHITHEELILAMLLYNPMIHPSIMMKKSIFDNDKNLLYDYNYPSAEDYKLWTLLALKGYRFANIPEILFYYRISCQQVTANCRHEMDESTLKIQREYGENIMKKIINQENRLRFFFQVLIELSNNELMDFKQQQTIIYFLYKKILALNSTLTD